MTPARVRGAYDSDLLAQPDALVATAERLRALAVPSLRAARFRRVVLTGMGSSLHALYPLHRRLCAAGVVSLWIETAELLTLAGGADGESLLVVVSQSGESVEVLQLLESGRRFGHIVGVTNTASSTLARRADSVVPLAAGAEASVSCRTYIATLAALDWLAAVLMNGDARAAVTEAADLAKPMQDYLFRVEWHVDALQEWVCGIESVFVVGRGDSLATAGASGLILKEATGRPAEGMSAAAFRHGPIEVSGPRVLVLTLAGDERAEPRDRRLVADVVRAGGRAAMVSRRAPTAAVFELPAVADRLLPLVEILPVQMLTLAFAARDGTEAGRFRHAAKITTVA